MSALTTIINGALNLAQFAYPPAAPFLSLLSRVAPYAEEGLPLLQAAIKEGPDAFDAAKKAAPGLFSAFQDLASKLKGSDANDQETAELAAHIINIDPPGWTHEETKRWWDRATENVV